MILASIQTLQVTVDMNEKISIASLTVDIATFFAIFFGLVIAYMEYGSYQKEKSIDRALMYADANSGSGENLGDHLQRVEELSLAHWDILTTFDPDISQDTTFESEVYIIEKVQSDSALKKSVDKISSHYDTLALCISEGLCDEAVSKALVESDLREFHNSVYPWLIHNIEKYKTDAAKPLICMHKSFQDDTDLKHISRQSRRGHICKKENRDKLIELLLLKDAD